MLIMFFIYKEQAFTLPVWGFSTLAVSTDGEAAAGRGPAASGGGRGEWGCSRATPRAGAGGDEGRRCLPDLWESIAATPAAPS